MEWVIILIEMAPPENIGIKTDLMVQLNYGQLYVNYK